MENKRAHFEPTADFTKVHNAIFRLYTKLPDFKADHALCYVYLTAQHNDDYGYAFPDTWDIALALNCGERKIADIKRVLAKYGLIETRRHPTFGNDVYFVYAPITDEAEFYDRYPEARANYEERKSSFDKRRRRGNEEPIAKYAITGSRNLRSANRDICDV